HFASEPDPERGLALAALTGNLSFASIKPAMLRALVEERIDPVLFGYSYDYVGDLAEPVSLIWEPPTGAGAGPGPSLAKAVEALSRVGRADAPRVMEHLLDRLAPESRFALIKLVTGGLRVGASARPAKQALADLGRVDIHEIEEIWHGLV